jgi:hypothetical protein
MFASFYGMGQAIKFGSLGGGLIDGGGVRSMFYDKIDKKLYVSGQFQKAENKLVWGVAVWYNNQWDSLKGGFTQFPQQPPTFPNEWSNFAHKIIRFQNKIYFVGGLTWVNGKNQYQMGVWNGVTWDYPIAEEPNGSILDLKVFHNVLYACGKFTKFGNTTCNYVAKFDGLSWQPVGDFSQFETNAQGPAQINAIEIYKNEIYVGGLFDDSGNTTRNIAKFDGTNWVNVGSGIQQGGINSINALEEFNGELYIGGRFDKTPEIPGQSLVIWDGINYKAVSSYGLQSGDYVESFKKHNDKLFIMGGFQKYGSFNAFMMFYLDSIQQCGLNGMESTFSNPTNQGIYRCELINDSLIVGGLYKYLDTLEVNKIGVITNWKNNSSCLFTGIKENFFNDNVINIYPNPATDKLNIECDAFETKKISLSISNSLGQAIYSLKDLSPKQEIDLTFLPSGIYFVSLQNNSEQKVFKILLR